MVCTFYGWHLQIGRQYLDQARPLLPFAVEDGMEVGQGRGLHARQKTLLPFDVEGLVFVFGHGAHDLFGGCVWRTRTALAALCCCSSKVRSRFELPPTRGMGMGKEQGSRGMSTLAFMGGLAVLLVAAVAWGGYQKAQRKAEAAQAIVAANERLDKAHKQWMEAMQVVRTTPRVGLSTPVLTMQALRQEVQALALPRCLEKSRGYFVAGMDAQLEGIVAFIRADMSKEALNAYTNAKTRLMNENFVEFGNKASACPANS